MNHWMRAGTLLGFKDLHRHKEKSFTITVQEQDGYSFHIDIQVSSCCADS